MQMLGRSFLLCLFVVDIISSSDLISFDEPYCAKGQMEIDLTVDYETTSGMNETVHIAMTNATIDVKCSNLLPVIHVAESAVITLRSGNDELELTFFRWNFFVSNVSLSHVNFNFVEDETRFVNTTKPGPRSSTNSSTGWSVDKQKIYRCSNFTTFDVTNGIVLTLRNFTWQIFNTQRIPTDENTVHCPSDSDGSKAPIEPANVLLFDLKIDGKIVGKIEGNVHFNISYNTSENKIKLVDFGLSDNFVVNGTQTGDKTVFNIYAKDDKKKNNVEWSVTFDKTSDGVQLSESVLLYDTTGLEDSDNKVITVKWNEKIKLATSPSNAYNCSSIEMSNNNSDKLTIKHATIQPFDLNKQQFGQATVCSQDQPTPPTPGDWVVTQEDASGVNYTCIKLTSIIDLLINYKTNNDSNSTATVQVPPNAYISAGSTCNYNFTSLQVDSSEQVLQLSFIPNGTVNTWVLTITFTNNKLYTKGNNVVAYLVGLKFFYDKNIFNNIDGSLSGQPAYETNNVNTTSGAGALTMFAAANDHSYRCNADETTSVTNIFSVKTESLRVEAFLKNTTTLLTEHVCASDQNQETSDLIPIIIGAALAALVVVVLVAYLIGRARARGTNYETI